MYVAWDNLHGRSTVVSFSWQNGDASGLEEYGKLTRQYLHHTHIPGEALSCKNQTCNLVNHNRGI